MAEWFFFYAANRSSDKISVTPNMCCSLGVFHAHNKKRKKFIHEIHQMSTHINWKVHFNDNERIWSTIWCIKWKLNWIINCSVACSADNTSISLPHSLPRTRINIKIDGVHQFANTSPHTHSQSLIEMALSQRHLQPYILSISIRFGFFFLFKVEIHLFIHRNGNGSGEQNLNEFFFSVCHWKLSSHTKVSPKFVHWLLFPFPTFLSYASLSLSATFSPRSLSLSLSLLVSVSVRRHHLHVLRFHLYVWSFAISMFALTDSRFFISFW